MAYAVQADISDRYGASYLLDAADRNGDDAVDASAVTAAINDVSSLIDQYLGQQYVTPLVSVPAWLVRCTVDLAVYELASEGRGPLTDEIKAKRVYWLGHLAMIAKGALGLGLGAGEPVPWTSPEIDGDPPEWTAEHTRGLL